MNSVFTTLNGYDLKSIRTVTVNRTTEQGLKLRSPLSLESTPYRYRQDRYNRGLTVPKKAVFY